MYIYVASIKVNKQNVFTSFAAPALCFVVRLLLASVMFDFVDTTLDAADSLSEPLASEDIYITQTSHKQYRLAILEIRVGKQAEYITNIFCDILRHTNEDFCLFGEIGLD